MCGIMAGNGTNVCVRKAHAGVVVIVAGPSMFNSFFFLLLPLFLCPVFFSFFLVVGNFSLKKEKKKTCS